MIKVILADDHNLVLEGIRSLLEKESGIKIAGEARDGLEAIKLASETKPDIVVLDVSMPNLNGIEAASEIRKVSPDSKILALSMHTDKRFVKKMLEAGASGYLLKNSAGSELIQAIETVYKGRTYLSQEIMDSLVRDYSSGHDVREKRLLPELSVRESETLKLLAEGKSIKDIASLLNISVKSVEVYKKQIMEKLNLHNLASLVKYAIREGLTDLED